MKIVDAFIGPVQSKYSAVAIFSALFVVCISILFSNNNISLDKKLLACLMLIVVSFPSILYILFQMSCIVTGSGKETPWCGILAWIIVFCTFLYAIVVVVITITSMSAAKDIATTENFYNNTNRYNKMPFMRHPRQGRPSNPRYGTTVPRKQSRSRLPTPFMYRSTPVIGV